MKRKLWNLVLAVTMVAMLVVSCAPAPTAAPTAAAQPTAAKPAEKITMQVLWTGWPEDTIKGIFDPVKAKFPNIEFKVEALPLAQLVPALEVRLGARNEVPDIYSVDGPLTASYAVRNHLVDIAPILGDDLKNFTKAATDQGSSKGKLMSVPYATSEILLYYNVDILKAAGIDPPALDIKQRWTWEKLYDMAKKATDPAKGTYGLVIEQADRPYQILAMPESKGAKVLSDDGLTSKGYVDSPKFIEAIQFYQKFYTEKLSPIGLDSNVSLEVFGQGKAAFFLAGAFSFNTLKSRYTDLKFGVAPHPFFEGGTPVTPTGSWHIGINPRSKYTKEAAEVIKFMTSDEQMINFFKLRGYPPVKSTVYAALPDTFNTDMWKIVQYELANTAIPRPATPGYREYEDLLLKALKDVQQGANVKDRLTEAAAAIDAEAFILPAASFRTGWPYEKT